MAEQDEVYQIWPLQTQAAQTLALLNIMGKPSQAYPAKTPPEGGKQHEGWNIGWEDVGLVDRGGRSVRGHYGMAHSRSCMLHFAGWSAH